MQHATKLCSVCYTKIKRIYPLRQPVSFSAPGHVGYALGPTLMRLTIWLNQLNANPQCKCAAEKKERKKASGESNLKIAEPPSVERNLWHFHSIGHKFSAKCQ